MMTYEAVCLNCGAQCHGDGGFLLRQRAPCDSCGSTSRRYPQLEKCHDGHRGATMRIRSVQQRPTSKKTVLEEKTGASFWADGKKLVWRQKTIDRSRGLYTEIVLDPTSGEVLHFCEEPLAVHQGHGSDKGRPDNGTADA